MRDVMDEERRQAARDSVHTLRSRLTYLLLCSHALQVQLHSRLSAQEQADLRQLAAVVEDTKAALQTLLKQLEPELKFETAGDRGEVIEIREDLGTPPGKNALPV
jgi:hypothetical protein